MSLDKTLKEYVHDNFKAPSSHIYHYTQPDSGIKIVCSGVLWLSLHTDLNKKNNREFKIGPEIIKSKLNNTSIEHVIPIFDKFILKGLKGYIASFCEEDNYEYTKKEYGKYCLGFKKSYLQQFRNNKTHILLGHVKYDRKEQEKIISEMIQLHEAYSDHPDNKLKALMIWLSIVIPFLKEKIDDQDKECRIVTAQIMHPNDSTKVVGRPCITEIKFSKSDIILPLPTSF